MFWRKRKGSSNSDSHICQLCETVNEIDAEICKSCYYQLGKNSREQEQAIDSTISNTLLNELMNKDFDSEASDEETVSVMTIDEVTIDVSEYPEENTDFLFISSEGPTFTSTEQYANDETNFTQDVVDEKSKENPIKQEFDDVSENLSDLSQNIVTQSIPATPSTLVHKNINPQFEDELDLEPEINIKSDSEDQLKINPKQRVSSNADNISNGTIWPWEMLDPWDPRDLHREIVSAMESAKRGDRNSAAEILDRIGPHLGERIEVIFHVGAVLRSIGRQNQLQQMLHAAKIKYPENENVVTAIANLGD